MSKTAAISVRVLPEVKAALEREAEADHRTLASIVEKILIEWLRNRNALTVPESLGGSGPARKGVKIYHAPSRRRVTL